MFQLLRRVQTRKIFLFLMGMVAFSSLTSWLMVDMIGIPCVVEIFLLFLFIKFRNEIEFNTNEIAIIIFLAVLGISIGALNNLFRVSEIMPIARCFLLGALGFIIAKDNDIFANLSNLYAFCSGVFFGDLLCSIIKFNTFIVIDNYQQYAVDINIICSVMWVVMTIIYKKNMWVLCAFILVPVLSFLSVSRGVATFFIMGIVLAYFLKTINNPSKLLTTVCILTVVGFIVTTVYFNSEQAVEELSPAMHFRLYEKVETYGNNQIDDGRFRPYFWAIENIDYYILPRGFLGKKFFNNIEGEIIPLMAPWDSAYLELLYTFGLPIMIIILIYFIRKLFKVYKYARIYQHPIFLIATVILAVLFIEHFFTYGLIRSPFTVFCNGAFLGFIVRLAQKPEIVIQSLSTVKE